MLVKLKRDFFGPEGVLYRANEGLAEIPSELRDQLPKDAEIVSEDGILPSKGLQAVPGYSALPEHEQELALIPGAAPSHQLTPDANEQPARDMNVDKREVKEGLEVVKKVEAEKAKTDPAKVKTGL